MAEIPEDMFGTVKHELKESKWRDNGENAAVLGNFDNSF